MRATLPQNVRPHIVPYGGLAMLAALARAAAALLLVPLLDAVFTVGPGAALPWLGVLAAAVLLGWGSEMRLMVHAFDIGFALIDHVNDRLIDHLLAMPIGLFTPARHGETKRALAGSITELLSAFVNLAGQVGISLLLPWLIAIGVLFIAWPLGVTMLVATPLLTAALLLGARLMRRAEADFAKASEEAAERTDEFAKAQLILRAAGRTDVTSTPLGDAVERQHRTSVRLLWLTVPGTLIYSLAFQIALIAIVAAIASLFAGGTVTAAVAVALIVVTVRFLEPFTTLAEFFPTIESVRGAITRTRDVFALPTLSIPKIDSEPLAPAVEFKGVGFEPGGVSVLEDISFVVPAGTITAIVGPSGSGKSTILSMVVRFYDADSGQVMVAGHDVRDYHPDTLVNQLAIVFQNVQLFEGGIADNIRISRPDASDEDVQEAAKAAQVDEIVARLGDWNALVGEGGSKLSGGERQRVSIARALLKNAPILLLDEATSSLDTVNEAAIAAAIKGYVGHTIIIVAHRLETIAHADHIVFVEAGRVVESGPRQQLIDMGGRFAAYWSQRRAARDWVL